MLLWVRKRRKWSLGAQSLCKSDKKIQALFIFFVKS